MKTTPAFLGLTVVLALFLPLPAFGAEKAKAEIDDSEIYYGDSGSFSAPAMVDVDAVYAQIPEYREIVQKNLDESDPRYHYLMRAASEKFMAAVAAAASDGGYDLVGGLGSIRIEGQKVPVITSLVIRKLAN